MNENDRASSVVEEGHAKAPSRSKTYKATFPTAWIVSSCPPSLAAEGAESQMRSRHTKELPYIQRSSTASDTVGVVGIMPQPTDQAPQIVPSSSSDKRERSKRGELLRNIFMRDAVPSGSATNPPLPPATPQSRFSIFRGITKNPKRKWEPMVPNPAAENNDASPVPRKVRHINQPPAKPALPAKPVFGPFAEETQRHTKADSPAESYDMADAPARAPTVAPTYTPASRVAKGGSGVKSVSQFPQG